MNKTKHISITSFELKIFSLLFYTAGKILIQIAFLYYDESTGFSGNIQKNLYEAGYVLTYIAIPVICYLTAIGALKTKSIKKYLIRLFAAACITESIFDICIFGKDFFTDFEVTKTALTSGSNLFFTLFLGSALITVSEHVIKTHFKEGSVRFVFLTVFATLFFSALAVILKSEQHVLGVLTIFAFYLFYGNMMFTFFAVILLQIFALGLSYTSAIMYAPIIGTIAIIFYDGRQGYNKKWVRIFMYTFYPMCYALIVLLIKNGAFR